MAVTLDQLLGLGSPTAANPTVSTLSHAVASGAVLFIQVMNYNPLALVTGGSVTDGTNTYTLTVDPVVANIDNGGGNVSLTFLSVYCTAGLANAATLSITYASGTPAVEQGGMSFLGCKTSGYYDISNAVARASYTTWTTPAVTTTVDGDVIVSAIANGSSGTTNTPTSPAIDGGQAGGFQAQQYDIQTTHGSTTRGGAWSASVPVGVAGIVAYKAATASAPVNTVAPVVTFAGTDPTQDSSLTSDGGTFTGTDGAITKTYAYYRDDYGSSDGVWNGGAAFTAIPSGDGGTTNPYVMTVADVDCYMACVTTATDSNGATTAVSNVVGLVVACPDPVVATTTTGTGFSSAARIDAEPPINVSTAAYAASLVVKTSKGILVGVTGYNSGGAQFIQIHDAAALPADTAVPIISVRVAATANFSIPFDSLAMRGKTFPTGIVVCNSSTGPAKTIGAADCFIEARYF